jgi:hypothetical protein
MSFSSGGRAGAGARARRGVCRGPASHQEQAPTEAGLNFAALFLLPRARAGLRHESSAPAGRGAA